MTDNQKDTPIKAPVPEPNKHFERGYRPPPPPPKPDGGYRPPPPPPKPTKK
ncbi:MAG: hypothetical protein PHX78_11455 [bacterium]|nr:hypothetical protein [bacterium]